MLFLNADFSVIKPDLGLIFWTILIFLLFWFLMSKFAFGPIGEGLKKREADIQTSLDEAKKAREEMKNLQSENEKLLQQAREERSLMLKDAKDAAEKYTSEMKEKAGAEYRRKVESAIQDIENHKQAAMIDLKNKTGAMAVEIAEKILREQLSGASASENFVQKLVNEAKFN